MFCCRGGYGFFDQIGDGLVSLVGPPAGHDHPEKSERGDIHDRESLPHRLGKAPKTTAAAKWDITRRRF